MKNVLITGANSYIGQAVRGHLAAAGHAVTVLDMLGEGWRQTDFSPFDAVFHVAGIAHDTGNTRDAALYYAVNRDLALATAGRAREHGVGQFVFMSSILVYNGCKDRTITAKTVPAVRGCYGDSKLQADLALQAMNTESFRVAVLRPPMIFGRGCKGNFPRLITLARKAPVFPDIANQRSMLYIGNLCEFVKLAIEHRSAGVFFPQNGDYFRTTDMVRTLAKLLGRRLRTTRLFNGPIRLASPLLPPLRKLFGSLIYEMEMSDHFEGRYRVADNQKSLEESI
jgi:UDP-glucose 4-epimerase